MSLQVAPHGEAQERRCMAPTQVTRVEESTVRRPAEYEALVRRFPSATSCGVATLVPQTVRVDKAFLDETGFRQPLVMHSSDQAELQVPKTGSMTLEDLLAAIGSERPVRAIDVGTQRELAEDWKLRQWMQYFNKAPTQRDRVLNLISLECTGTKLDKLVRPPKVVGEIGWVEKHWAAAVKKERAMAPQVRLYCLMSAAGSYTEFHIDFGGSSVWYHLYKGRKYFFVIPPTRDNFERFTKWEAQYRHGQALFFGDLITEGKCAVIEMNAGDTLLLPSGWIHAVYTPEDSISFGGNFLCGYHMPTQIQCHAKEKMQHVEGRFHFPEFECVVWYATAYYAKMLSTCPSILNKWEWEGLGVLVDALEEWLKGETADSKLLGRITIICKATVHSTPSVLLDKMRDAVRTRRPTIASQVPQLSSGSSHRVKAENLLPKDALSPGVTDDSSSSSSSSSDESSSDSSESSSDETSDDEDNGKNDSDDDRAGTEDDDGKETNESASDSGSDEESASSSSSSDNEEGEKEKEEAPREPDETKEPEEEEEMDNPEESSSSESDNSSDPESAYPDLPPIPVDELISIRKRAKMKELQISKQGKERIVALAQQHMWERQHGSKSKKKKNVVAVITPWTEDSNWIVACSCGLGGENYDDGREMVECSNCQNWVHIQCAGPPIPEIFWCFKCRKLEDDWLFVCPCGIKQKNYDDGGRMVQCEKCSVWQHTLCRGIPDDEDPPTPYECTVCLELKKLKKRGKAGQQRKRSNTGKSRDNKKAPVPVTPIPIEPGYVPVSPPPPSVSPPPPPPPPPSSAPPSPGMHAANGSHATEDTLHIRDVKYPDAHKRHRSSHSRSQWKEKGHVLTTSHDTAHENHDGTSNIVRPPLPITPKSPNTPTSSKRKSGGGSARDRLEKKLKVRKSHG